MMNSYFSEKICIENEPFLFPFFNGIIPRKINKAYVFSVRFRAKYIEDTYVLKIKDVTFVSYHYM